jgi:hypothetical protein
VFAASLAGSPATLVFSKIHAMPWALIPNEMAAQTPHGMLTNPADVLPAECLLGFGDKDLLVADKGGGIVSSWSISRSKRRSSAGPDCHSSTVRVYGGGFPSSTPK